jgi:prepilin-type N-terminal cleavage/methylation domain-containing protein
MWHRSERGFSVIELMIVIVAGGLLVVLGLNFFSTNYLRYLRLQEDAIKFSTLSVQSQRVAKVLRGSVDVLEATNSSITVYAYFTPRDATVSRIRYYHDAAAKKLMADVTPMSAAPPLGTPISAQLVTYTIINNFFVASGVSVFEYLDSAGGTLTTWTTLRDIKGVRFTMAVPKTDFATSKDTTITAEVALRNRKTNL